MAKLTVPIVVDWDDIQKELEKYDFVEVVRCRDCKFSIPLRDIESSVFTYDCGIFGRLDLAEDFYCADGERREDE